jgi:glyoxalase-like protein
VKLDHVILGTNDLEAAGSRLYRELGLASIPGGRHADWGTANRIVPLGDTYLEILGVVDPDQASRSFLGKHLQEQVATRDRLIGWCIAPDDLDETASRLDLEITLGSRTLPDGSILRWRSAGLEQAIASHVLPFFIEWDVPAELHPGRMAVNHRIHPLGVPVVEVGGDVMRVAEWLGQPGSWVLTVGGSPGVRALSIATSSGDLVVR